MWPFGTPKNDDNEFLLDLIKNLNERAKLMNDRIDALVDQVASLHEQVSALSARNKETDQ